MSRQKVDFCTGGKSNKKSNRKYTSVNLLNDATSGELNLGHATYIRKF